MADKTYSFSWPSASGTVPVTQLGFTLKFTSEDAELKFTEGLATYNTFDMHWKPCATEPKWTEVTLDNYKCLDAKTGDEMAVDVIRPTKSFYVDERGQFVELTNIDSLVSMVERLTLDASADPDEEENAEEKSQRESFVKQYVDQSRSQTKQAVTNEVSLMWNAFVQAWLDVPTDQTGNNIFFQASLAHAGKACVKLGKSFKQDPEAYKALVQQQITSTFALSMPEHEVPTIEVAAAALTTEFVTTVESDTLLAHTADFTRVNESLFFVDDEQSSSLEVKCQRWLLAWPGRDELAAEAFLTRCYDEYVQTAQATFTQIMANLGLDEDDDEDADDLEADEADEPEFEEQQPVQSAEQAEETAPNATEKAQA